MSITLIISQIDSTIRLLESQKEQKQKEDIKNNNESEHKSSTIINNASPLTTDVNVVCYNRLCEEFGCTLLDTSKLNLIQKLTNTKPHTMLRRNIYYAHRDLETVLKSYANGEKFYLYTGRGPSSASMHLGHMIPFLFTKYLQEAFGVVCVIQITDDEKFFYKANIKTLEDAYKYGIENIKDIIAMGFDINKTFIFMDTQYIQFMYPNICRVQNKLSLQTTKKVFGFNENYKEPVTIGKLAYPSIQVVPAFSSTFKQIFGNSYKNMRCLIPCAIDQDPYFRITRDIAPKLGEKKCSCLYSKFIPGLKGANSKMASSDPTSAIFLNDSEDNIRNKIKKYAVSGGGKTKKEHKINGANLDKDVAYQYLKYF
eukprot:265247_1